jgi:hypothetical protein
MNLLQVSVISFLLFEGCSKMDDTKTGDPDETGKCTNTVRATIVNKTGLDGCGWLLQLSDGSSLEPTNLSDFGIELVDNKTVDVSYTEVNMISICMVGPVVEINCMEEDHY